MVVGVGLYGDAVALLDCCFRQAVLFVIGVGCRFASAFLCEVPVCVVFVCGGSLRPALRDDLV